MFEWVSLLGYAYKKVHNNVSIAQSDTFLYQWILTVDVEHWDLQILKKRTYKEFLWKLYL